MPATQFFGVVQSANQKGNLVTQIKIPRGYPVGAHNNVGVWSVHGTTGRTLSVTDDKGGTYTKREDLTRGDRAEIWTREDVTDGPSTIILNVDSTGSNYVCGGWGEACGVGAYDASHSASGTSATPQAGSFSPANGALLCTAAHQDSSSALLTLVTADSGFTQMTSSLDHISYLYSAWKLHTTGAINPGYTFNASRGWTALAWSWVADTSKGTAPPTTAFNNAVTHNSFDVNETSPLKVQVCSVGAAGLALYCQNGPGIAVTSITDTNGNTWALGKALGNGSGGTNEFWYCKNPTGSNDLLASINMSGSIANCLISAIKLTGSDQAAMIGATASTSGTDAVGTTIVGSTITPNAANSLVFSLLGVQSQTVISVNNVGFWSCVSTPTIGSPAPLMQNNGYGLKYLPSGAIQNTWTLDGPPRDWQEIQVEVLSAASTAYTLTASGSTYTLTGTAVSFTRGRPIVAASGAFAMTGSAATLRRGSSLGVSSGAYAVTGSPVTLRHGQVTAANTGVFVITGTPATLRKGTVMPAVAASYGISGSVVTFRHTIKLVASAGVFALGGSDAGLIYGTAGSFTISAQAAAYTFTGSTAGLKAARRLNSASGAFVVSGPDIALLISQRRLTASPGSYLFTGSPASLAPSSIAGLAIATISNRLVTTVTLTESLL